MLENEPTTAQDSSAPDTGQPDQAPVKRTRRRAASRPAGTPTAEAAAAAEAVAEAAAAAPPAAMTASARPEPEPAEAAASAAAESGEEAAPAPVRKRAARKATTATTTAKKATATANRRRVRAAAVAPEPAEAESEATGSGPAAPTVAEHVADSSPATTPEQDEDALTEEEADDLAGLSVQELVDEAQSLFTRAMAPAEPERAPAAAPVLRPGALIFQAPVAVTPVRRTRSASRPQSAPGAVSGRAAENLPDQDEDEVIRDLAEPDRKSVV